MDTAVILAFASAILSGTMTLGVAWLGRRSLAHWSFAAGMAVLAIESLFAGLAADAVAKENLLYWQNWRLVAMAFLPATWLFFSLSYARGNARESLARWRFGLVAAFLVPVGLAIGFRGQLIILEYPTGPAGPWILRLRAPGLALNLLFLLSAVLVLMNLEHTYRAAVGTMRWRIKFMLLGLGVLFVIRAYSSSQVLLFRALNLELRGLNSAALLLACALISRSLLRAGHFEVNVFPSHSVLHGSLTVMLAGVYLLIVGVLAQVVTFLGGDASFTLKAFMVLVLLVLLTLLLLSDRVRLHTKRFVSRHFQRPLYDYRAVWRTFTEATTRRVEQADLCGAITRLASEIFQALSVTVWVVDDRSNGLAFAASTSLSDTKAAHLQLDAADAAQVVAALATHPEPVDLDSSKENWASVLRRLQPDQFPQKGGNRICVPMIAGGELLGVLMLGDRVGGMPYSTQDFDLLKSVSEQAAACLLNIRLSQRLSQARQLEAFQAMSAFFVHDLKNTASTLSLMLQNLPLHYQDPQFREDALRGIGKTVAHINELIGRLSLLREELTIHPVECDLNELVTEALKCLGEQPRMELVRELRPLPKLRLDPTQIQNVVTNLLFNARDAIGPDGRIQVETSRRNGWAVLTVADNGCGMNPEFVRNSLFRPFQTTKKRGFGIGMFQCKMIVEAHHGKIEVESEPGKGTTFRVLLPTGQTIP
jgi:putative PEP-CTERM system histidine kinase